MLEIVFDENKENSFLGRKCKVVEVKKPLNLAWNDYRQLARNLLTENKDEQMLIVKFSSNGESLNYFALALSVESYDEKSMLESVVFKVKHSGATMLDYKPFMALANSIRYARDLYRMSEEEYLADIKRLGYLGLKIREDYLNQKIVIEWQGLGDEILLAATSKNQTMVLIGILKTWAICKEKFKATGIISKQRESLSDAENIPEADSEDEMIELIINFVRSRYEKR